jgi:hypothetical protein
MASTINATPTSSGLIQTADNSGVLALQTGGTTAVTIDGSQNVSIGTTTTSYGKFSVNGTINPLAGNKIQFQNSANSNYSAIYNPSTDSGASLAFQNGGGTVMSILNNGATIMGTATSENGQNSISFSNSSDTSSYGKAMLFNTQYASTRNAVVFQYNSGTVGTIVTGTSNTSYNTSSDYRLKENIAPMTGALAKVTQLKPCTYKWKLDGSDGEGFIAHELAEVCPHAVSGVKDAVETYTDEDGNEQTRIKPQGIDTSFLVATLTAAIQEQQALITQLQADVQALKGVK